MAVNELTPVAARARQDIVSLGQGRLHNIATLVQSEPSRVAQQALPLLRAAADNQTMSEHDILVLAYYLKVRLGL